MTIEQMVLQISLPVLGLSVVLAAYRLARGPTLPDRVVAFDLMATIGIAIVAVYGMATEEPMILDVAIVLALISFLGTVAFARYLERRI